MACKCTDCGGEYTVDILVPEETLAALGEQEELGLLCPSCIGKKIEEKTEGYVAFRLEPVC